MKINKDTITFEKKDNILFDGRIISDGYMAIDLEQIFCFKFKFKFPDNRLTEAFINKTKFTKEYSTIKIGTDCIQMLNLEIAFTKQNTQYEGTLTDFIYKSSALIINPHTQARAWVDKQYVELFKGLDIQISNEHSPVYGCMGGMQAVCVMPIRISAYFEENKMLDEVVKAACNYASLD